jgi:hypothetical protein
MDVAVAAKVNVGPVRMTAGEQREDAQVDRSESGAPRGA